MKEKKERHIDDKRKIIFLRISMIFFSSTSFNRSCNVNIIAIVMKDDVLLFLLHNVNDDDDF